MVHEVEGVVEGVGVGEDVRMQEGQQRVELVQVVLHGGARQQHRVLVPAGAGGGAVTACSCTGADFVKELFSALSMVQTFGPAFQGGQCHQGCGR